MKLPRPVTVGADFLRNGILPPAADFFEKACAVSSYLMGVNPFNQPGVESYKKNMFALLGKPGYEKESEAIRARL